MNKQQQQREEQLSALLDNALDGTQLESFMQDLKRDPIADAESAQRYRLMGDAMRDELDQASFMDISSAVHRAIEDEPAHTEVKVATKQKSSVTASQRISAWLQSLKGPLTGVAVAASVAMITLVTFNNVQNTDTAVQPAQLAQVAPIEKVNIEIARNVQVASTLDISKKSPEQQQQLNQYMQKHSGYASQSTMQGMMPYVRAAGAQSEEALQQKK